MHRIDGPTRSASLPAPEPAGTGASSPGYFAHGDIEGGVPWTRTTPDWANAVQEELAGAIEGAGITLDKADNNQLYAAIVQIVDDTLAATPPSSSLGANGWRIHPDGYIEQWGHYSSAVNSEGSVSFDFNIPFPTACFGVDATIVNPGASTSGSSLVQEVSVSTTGATVMIQSHTSPNGDAAGGFKWRARGY